jgi:deoxyribose-phosphate aldolase
MPIAHFIDHTMLEPSTVLADIKKICDEAIAYGFAAVCIPPYFVHDARQAIGKGPVKVATVVGFPFGYSHYASKLKETEQAMEDGANEIDMVMNVTAFKSNDLAWLETEIKNIAAAVADKNAVLKVIIESGILTKEEIIKCCELYKHYPVHFLKTSTGYAEKGASIADVEIMRAHLPAHIQIKASGGIRDYAFASALIQAGATRLGCSASVEIVKEE